MIKLEVKVNLAGTSVSGDPLYEAHYYNRFKDIEDLAQLGFTSFEIDALRLFKSKHVFDRNGGICLKWHTIGTTPDKALDALKKEVRRDIDGAVELFNKHLEEAKLYQQRAVAEKHIIEC